jgi:Putative zinc-finger
MTDSDQLRHDEARAALAEYALGILDGRERASVMTHVETCGECAAEFDALTTTVDSLAHLPSPADPPLGFESRVMKRVRLSGTRVARPAHRLARWAAAATVAAGAFGVGWALEHATSTRPPAKSADSTIVERALVSGTRTVGSIWVDSGRTSWMFVSLDLPGAPGRITCQIVTTTGRRELVGTYSLYGGHGAWGARLPVAWALVRTVQINSTAGARLATLGGPAWHAPGTTATE